MNTDIAAAFLSVGGEGNQGGEQHQGTQGPSPLPLETMSPWRFIISAN